MRKSKLLLVLLVLTGLLLAQRSGLLAAFAEPLRIKQALLGLGGWGYVGFVAAYAALQPFGVPGTVFIVAAPLIWPWPVAFALSMLGTMAASVVGFSVSRFLLRDWLAPRIPARFRAYEAALARRGLLTVFLLRLVFWMPPLLHAFFGLSQVRFWTHFWGSLAGYLLPLLLVSYFGERLLLALRTAPLWVWLLLAVPPIALALVGWRRARAPLAKVIK